MQLTTAATPVLAEKFKDQRLTQKGEPRAFVGLEKLTTLWFNTGTLCNIACSHCYIESTPTNDRLSYLSLSDVEQMLTQAEALNPEPLEIGFTGGEPFLNKDCIAMMRAALQRGHRILMLTNAMQPMQRKHVQEGLLDLQDKFLRKPPTTARLEMRVSIDHFTSQRHDQERGAGSFDKTREGIDWLVRHGFYVTLAGRTMWGEKEEELRSGYHKLITDEGWPIDANNPHEVVLFPEMDETKDVPEITTACWQIVGKSPSDMMCATSRMIVKPKGESQCQVMPCTLLPYEKDFALGSSLTASLSHSGGNIEQGQVYLNHPHCARFCVLGGGSCSVKG